MDWDQLAASVVWDERLGFGGDGNRSGAGPFSMKDKFPKPSYCVTSGPFKDVQVMYGTETPAAHCLSRGFYHYEKHIFGQISGEHLAPDKVKALQSAANYDELRNGTEIMVHNGIHWGVGGDFERWSSANGETCRRDASSRFNEIQ